MAGPVSEPLFSPGGYQDKELCLLCSKKFKKKEVTNTLTAVGWQKFKENAEKWSVIDVPFADSAHRFTEVLQKVKSSDEPFGKVHKSCRATFENNSERFKEKYGLIKASAFLDESDTLETEDTFVPSPKKRKIRPRGEHSFEKEKCFICSEKKDTDQLRPYNQGGLGRCSDTNAADRILERQKIFLADKANRFYEAARRLELLLSGASHDIFAVDVYYHQACYLKFAHSTIPNEGESSDSDDSKEQHAIQAFFYKIKAKIIRDKQAFLLNELLKDVELICEDTGLEKPIILTTQTLKRKLIAEFGPDISFYRQGKYLIVHASDINPCEYATATLQGCGLRDDDLTKAFGRMIRRKLEARENLGKQWPCTTEEIFSQLDRGPLPEIYNAIFYTIKDYGEKNEYGYNKTTSRVKATKIWSLASDWENLITKQPSPKQSILGLVLHRITGSKESIGYLHKLNHTISYNDIRLQNMAWSRMVTSRQSLPLGIRKGVVTHSTIDNIDAAQDTITGAGTTHYTNKTVFQLLKDGENTLPTIADCPEAPLDICTEPEMQRLEVPQFSLGKRCGPSLFENFKDIKEDGMLELRFKKDFAWSLAGSLPARYEDQDLPLLGSWTAFQHAVTDAETTECVLEYLPMTPDTPDYPVCKEYLDCLLEMMMELEIPHIFVHADEMVYAKLYHIIWKNPSLYRQIKVLMGGFHQLRVRQRLLHKRHAVKGYKQWWIDAEKIASGSADKAIEGGHYYRCMRMHKETFDALVQYFVEESTQDLATLDMNLLNGLISLRKKPSASALEHVMAMQSFKDLIALLLQGIDGTEKRLTVAYLKDVSALLSMVAAVRENNIELHLQAERNMIPLTFAFNHVNYARYCTYQHVLLQSWQASNSAAFKDLKELGFGGSITGSRFSTIHGDLITELFNREAKGTAGPFKSGYSGNIDAVNTWIATSHIHSKLRIALRQEVLLKTSSVHKEDTLGGKKLRKKHVDSLKTTLQNYGTNPFASSPAKIISTGEEIDIEVVNDLLRAFAVGEDCMLQFIDDRLITGSVDFFQPIKRTKLKTGLEKKKKTPTAISVLKEERQAFGILVSKASSLEEAFSYPITSVPLSIATADSTLRQSDKASLQRFLLEESQCIKDEPPQNAVWIIDGMAAVRSLKPKPTYRAWIESILNFVTPKAEMNACEVHIVNDTYLDSSVKNDTRKKRGEPGPRVHLEGYDQKMLQGSKWQEFLHRNDNKTDLIQLIARYIREEACYTRAMPIVFTSCKETFCIRNGRVHEMDECNHEEADTRLILHAIQSEKDVVIVAKDTDVLVLMVWAYCVLNITQKWFFRKDNGQYADVSEICSHFGRDLCVYLPALHALSGCDTTSYFYNVGKVKLIKKVTKNTPSLTFLEHLGKEKSLNECDIQEIQKFVQIVMYSGKDNESYVSTRVRLYESLKVKSSLSIPPDPSSLQQAILRAHWQVYHWLRCTDAIVEDLRWEECGWKLCSGESYLQPVWFTCPQLPPSLRRRSSKKKKMSDSEDGDVESVEEEERAPNRRKRRAKIAEKTHPVKAPAEAPITDDEGSSDSDRETMSDESPDDQESDWEVSDFTSSDESGDEWMP